MPFFLTGLGAALVQFAEGLVMGAAICTLGSRLHLK